MPKVSVILTSYNHEKYVREAISSVLEQSYGDYELIIWDDCSSDGSWEIIRSFEDRRIVAYRNETNLGGGNVNRALEIASGEYIAIHHSDDVWEPRKLEMQVAFLDAHPEIGAVFTNALAIGEDGEPFDDPDHFYSKVFDQPNRSRHQWLNHFFYHSNALCHPSVLVRKKCYETCGPYRRGLAQLPDFDMWVRLCLRYEIHVMPEKLVRFRVRANEANSSGIRPETRIRSITEAYLVLKNYLQVERFEDLVVIFPEAASFYREEGFEPRFVLAMVALAPSAPPWAKPFAIDLLYALFWDPAKAEELARIYGFTSKDLVRLTAEHDIFAQQRNQELNLLLNDASDRAAEVGRLLAERESTIASLAKGVEERDARIMQLGETAGNLERRGRELQAALEALERESNALRLSLEERGERLAAAESLAAERRSAIAGLQQDVAGLRRDLALKKQEVESLLNSLSWKITKPLRNIYRVLFAR